MTIAYIGLGSNLDRPDRQIAHALRELADLPATTLIRQSSLYCSRPLGTARQPDFINAAAMLETSLPARELLGFMQAIEDRQGRDRTVPRWGPRTLDLDLLVYGGEQIREQDLRVPHPQIDRRNFVLWPLVEISRDLDIPGFGLARELLEKTGYTDIEKISEHGRPHP